MTVPYPISHGPWRVENGALVLDRPEPAAEAPAEQPAPAEPESTPAPRKRRTSTTED
jgi:hypothetical protein